MSNLKRKIVNDNTPFEKLSDNENIFIVFSNDFLQNHKEGVERLKACKVINATENTMTEDGEMDIDDYTTSKQKHENGSNG